jgi:hypothetical protein
MKFGQEFIFSNLSGSSIYNWEILWTYWSFLVSYLPKECVIFIALS